MYTFNDVEKNLLYIKEYLECIMYYHMLYSEKFEYYRFDELFEELYSLKNNYKENTFITDKYIMKLDKIGSETDIELDKIRNEKGDEWLNGFMKNEKAHKRAARKIKLLRIRNKE